MADLLAAGGGAIPNAHPGAAPPTTGSVPLHPSAAPVPTSSPSGIRGPRMIMMERAAREARRQAAEKQRLEEARAEEAARQSEDLRRQGIEQQPAGVAGGRTVNIAQQAADAAAQRQAQASQDRAQAHQRMPSHTLQVQSPSATAAPQQPPSQAYLSQGSAAQQRRASESRPEPAPAPAADPAKPRNSFPHAFERWETLSAHWEGLTSYWIRKLEQNKDDVNRDALSQQLARQVTDLSAAGANLFHAVVELQRLRASSERKFQRWFFETRSELERAQEVNALLEKALEKERRERSDAVGDTVEKQRIVAKNEEMKKELAISKEEARRAWEELGRREQEERDRTLSLQSGHPTIVGGVQVVPMTQSHSTRQTSSRDAGNYQPADVSRTPTEHRSPAAAGGTSGYYAQPEGSGTGHRGAQAAAAQDEIGYRQSEYLLDPQGQPLLDVHGEKIPTYVAPSSTYSGSEQEVEEYETPATTNPPSGGQETPASGAPSGGSHGSSSNNDQWTGAYSNPQDYSGEGYGTPEWETIQRQNHHHPSRLSKIDEEDERSRASTSQIGRI